MTVSLPRDLDGCKSAAARHLCFDELLQASQGLTDLIEEFNAWDGSGVTDEDEGIPHIRYNNTPESNIHQSGNVIARESERQP